MRSISVSAFVALAFASGLSSAEQLGDHGTFVIGVDRVFGYVSQTTSYDYTTTVPTQTGTTTTKTTHETTTSQFSFLGHYLPISVGQVPRLSFDAFVGPGISLGGSIMYDYYSYGHKDNGVEDPDKQSTGIWLLSPRVGFGHMFTPVVGIWPRAGVTYAHESTDSPSTNVTTGVVTHTTSSTGALYYTMDVNLVVTPLPHIGFTVGPTLDYLLSQSSSQTPPATNPETNHKEHALGLQAGFFGWF